MEVLVRSVDRKAMLRVIIFLSSNCVCVLDLGRYYERWDDSDGMYSTEADEQAIKISAQPQGNHSAKLQSRTI